MLACELDLCRVLASELHQGCVVCVQSHVRKKCMHVTGHPCRQMKCGCVTCIKVALVQATLCQPPVQQGRRCVEVEPPPVSARRTVQQIWLVYKWEALQPLAGCVRESFRRR